MPPARRATAKSDVVKSVHHSERHSPVAENYLLTLYTMDEEGIRPTLSNLAGSLKQLPEGEGLGTTLPTVAGMLRRMQKEGLLTLTSNKEIHLTTEGETLAEDMAARHRLAECMVVDLLGVELHHAHIEAHRLEHAITPSLLIRIRDRLGNPASSPFGRPIPGSGKETTGKDAIPLDRCKPGKEYVVVRVPEDDQELLEFLVDRRIVPRSVIGLAEVAPYRGVVMILVSSAEVALGKEVAPRLWVRPADVSTK